MMMSSTNNTPRRKISAQHSRTNSEVSELSAHHDLLLDNDSDDDDGGDDQEPVVIISLSQDEDYDTDNTIRPAGYAGSPLASSLTSKKRRALLALVVPLIIALTFRMVHTETPLPEKTLHGHYSKYAPSIPKNKTKTKTNSHNSRSGKDAATSQKIVDINAPPVELPEGETMAHLAESKNDQGPDQSQENHHDHENAAPSHFFPNSLRNAPTASFSRSASVASVATKAATEERPLPVVIDRGEIPAGVISVFKKISAAEALMCRQAVIDYVINATNGKDECHGLQKAFDETCSQVDDEDSPLIEPTDPKVVDENDIWLGEEPPGTRQRGRRRKLLTRQRRSKRWEEQDLWTFILDEIYHYWELFSQWRFSKPKFFPEEMVFGFFPKAHTAVVQGECQQQQQQRRQLEQFEQRVHVPDTLELDQKVTDALKVMDDDNDVDDDEISDKSATTTRTAATTTANSTIAPVHNGVQETNIADTVAPLPFVVEETQAPLINTHPVKPHTILNLPTGHQHVSGKTLENTLFLQHEDKVLSDLKKAAANATNSANVNHTAAASVDAKEDAAASAKAVADTSDLVSTFLNDPTSIEARACCASILNVYHENCNVDAEEDISDQRLFIVVLIMAFCGMVKSLIRNYKLRWLPEAAGCILVGMASGYVSSYFPHQDFSFDGNWFLRILVPPIVFEAALSIDKKAFNRHLVPILFYSTAGTLLSTLLTATIVHTGTLWMGRYCETIPYIESLIFGSLISSIDPVAALSALSNIGMTDTDTLYVLVFGESLLNDGVALVLFEVLERFLDTNLVIDKEAITAAVMHFLVVACGSILVGVGSGIMCTVYYWAFHGCQTPLVEVLMFLCWALLPYYVCDGIGWSGIVSIVVVGFLMDMYVVGLGDSEDSDSEHSHKAGGREAAPGDVFHEVVKKRKVRPIFTGEGHLSTEARTHIGFVTEIVATMMETAIFAYLGLFLFSHRYHWNGFHIFISIFATSASRGIMIPVLSTCANAITNAQKYQNRCRGRHKNAPAVGVIVDRKMQMILWFAGLRGAMSFALVEHIPLFDAVTGEGSRVKAELKAMTSASIMFTVFVLGGSTNYVMEYMGLSPAAKKRGRNATRNSNMEMVPLTTLSSDTSDMNGNGHGHHRESSRGLDDSLKTRKTRQRVRAKDDLER